MVNRWLKSGIAFLLVASVGIAQSQSTGVAGFLQRAGAVIKTGAGQVLGKPNTVGGTATTTGATFRPIDPAVGGQFEGLFDHWHPGATWPRAAITFTRFGSRLPCWTAQATIWQSATQHHVETFEICNAPLFIHDDLGGTQQLSATNTTSSVTQSMDGAQNIEGISHVQSATARDTGPNPPHMLFTLNWGNSGNTLMPQYHEILLRLMYACSYEDPTSKGINNMLGKLLWVARFDPSGNVDTGAAK